MQQIGRYYCHLHARAVRIPGLLPCGRVSGTLPVSLPFSAHPMRRITQDNCSLPYSTSATRSGIELLPLIIVNVATLISAGRIIARTGRYVCLSSLFTTAILNICLEPYRPYYVMILGPAIMTVGCGLLYSVKLSNSKSYPMGYSAFIGFGVGLVLQNVIVGPIHLVGCDPSTYDHRDIIVDLCSA